MILHRKLSWNRVNISRLRKLKPTSKIKVSTLHCPMCRGLGSRRRAPNGRYSKLAYKCTTCLGRGIPPIPVSELDVET